jgi:hypothetical protein
MNPAAALPKKSRRWTLSEEPALRGYVVEWAEEGDYILSRRDELFRSTQLRPPFERIGRFPASPWKSMLSRLRPAQRAFRWMYYNTLKLPNGDLFLTFAKHVGVHTQGHFELLDSQLVRPCRILRSGCGVDPSGDVFFGEYVSNEARDLIRVYRYSSRHQKIETAYEFAPRVIRHIHGIYWDPYSRSLWVCAGDVGAENRILRTSDGFRTLEMVGGGDETWRSVSLQFTPDAIYYGTDAELRQNMIYRIDRKTGERGEVTEVGGTVFYSQKVGPDIFFGVTAELCPSQNDSAASLWAVGEHGSCERVSVFHKDGWHRILFMFGTLHFPAGPGLKDALYVHGVALKGLDNGTCRISLSPQ